MQKQSEIIAIWNLSIIFNPPSLYSKMSFGKTKIIKYIRVLISYQLLLSKALYQYIY